MEMQREQQAIVRADWEIYRGSEGITGVWIRFWADFWANFIWQDAVFLCIYCFMRGCGVRITLASAGGSACIAITPLVRLHQVNRVLIDWLIDLRESRQEWVFRLRTSVMSCFPTYVFNLINS
jgi:hypothetical protein